MLRSIRLETRVSNTLVGKGTARTITVFQDSQPITYLEVGATGLLDLDRAVKALNEGNAGVNVSLRVQGSQQNHAVETDFNRLDKQLREAPRPITGFIFKPSGRKRAHLDKDILTIEDVTVTVYAGSEILVQEVNITIEMDARGSIWLKN